MEKILSEKESLCPKNCAIFTERYRMEIFALIVAAGRGLRMKTDTKKQYLLLNGIPVLTRTVMAFYNNKYIKKIALIIPKEDMDYCRLKVLVPFKLMNKVHLVPGGTERQDSVYFGLQYIEKHFNFEKDPLVMIHDGVRPLISQNMIVESIEYTVKLKSCIPGLKIPDTIKRLSPEGIVEKTMDRDHLYLIQTPQNFFLKSIIRAFEYAIQTSFSGTDDASIMEHSGQAVHVIQGEKINIKITTPEDLALAEYHMSSISNMDNTM
jgi:2-C-methyl-D-erythritol 4-phosphate cytidylyltransferase